jgi:hypothetical protein
MCMYALVMPHSPNQVNTCERRGRELDAAPNMATLPPGSARPAAHLSAGTPCPCWQMVAHGNGAGRRYTSTQLLC